MTPAEQVEALLRPLLADRETELRTVRHGGYYETVAPEAVLEYIRRGPSGA